MDAALLTMVTALFAAVLASAFDQRREGAKTRDKLDENTSALREVAARTTILEASHRHLLQAFGHLREEFGHLREDFGHLREDFGHLREDFGHLREDFGEHRSITDKNHSEIVGSLSNARERLARLGGWCFLWGRAGPVG